VKKLLRSTTGIILLILFAGSLAVLRPWSYLANIPFISPTTALTVNVLYGKASVYLDSQKVGETPYSSEQLTPGDHSLRIERIASTDEFYPSIQKQIHLESNTRTFVEAEIGPDDQFTSLKLVYYQKSSGGGTSVYVDTTPSGATVTIDDVRYGTSPATSDKLPAGRHTLKVVTAGYEDEETVVIAREGYTLIADIQLMAKPIELAAP